MSDSAHLTAQGNVSPLLDDALDQPDDTAEVEAMAESKPLAEKTERTPARSYPATAKRVEVRVESILVDDDLGRVHEDSQIDAQIVERYGLLYPIMVDNSLKLLAGDQWLAAVKKLGWEMVEVQIVEVA